jgi:hypothetical protein
LERRIDEPARAVRRADEDVRVDVKAERLRAREERSKRRDVD